MSKERKLLSFEEVNACLTYSQTTGELTWKYRPLEHFKNTKGWAIFNGRFAGRLAGTLNNKGHIQINIFGRLYQAHRLAWLLTTGKWPLDQLDHVDHDKNNNRIENLREVTASINMRNQKLNRNNSSGFCGVCRGRRGWIAQVKMNKKMHHLGIFETAEEADIAVKAFRKQNDFHENHGVTLQ